MLCKSPGTNASQAPHPDKAGRLPKGRITEQETIVSTVSDLLEQNRQQAENSGTQRDAMGIDLIHASVREGYSQTIQAKIVDCGKG